MVAKHKPARRERTRGKIPKLIIVTGGVLSGLGKGVTTASIGNILKARGFRVNTQKFDQYLNVDAGTLNPGEHGEVFVTDDGAETDLDLGHYERFLDQSLTKDCSVMTGQIYLEVTQAEREGKYLGKTVQMIPHVTDAVKRRMWAAARRSHAEIHLVEVGGTVGDYEGAHFLEAVRQLAADDGKENVLYVHVAFLPYLAASDEIKTKPAQNSVRDLRAIGIQPDVIIARADHPISKSQLEKLSLYANVDVASVIPVPTVGSMYEVPLHMEAHGLDRIIAQKLGLGFRPRNDRIWHRLVATIKRRKPPVRIAMVGKYLNMKDTYMSLIEALKAAAWAHGRSLDLWWVDAEQIESGKFPVEELQHAAGIAVPGGFGVRGTEGKIRAIRFAREKKIPYLGLCFGMQLMVIETARHLARLPHATSEEFAPAEKKRDPVIHLMGEQKKTLLKGGTMRLGAWPCALKEKSLARKLYGERRISERHRHRYEFNNAYRAKLERAGLAVSGTTPDGQLVEIVERPDHPFFLGVQFHPEFQSRPTRPHPLFLGFLKAAISSRKTASRGR
ncbi:MAG: CTP synthase [Parcubacteria group bacterium Gr01-1014_38]|nr:MAG: CTP synthase [Parcubacteria group bacterium Gr01-1014_38]